MNLYQKLLMKSAAAAPEPVVGYPLYAWGDNNNGGLGLNESSISRSSPTQVGSSSWTAVSANTSDVTAIGYDGSMYSWGANNGNYILGIGFVSTHRSSPTLVSSASWSQVSVGASHTLALAQDKTLWGWGDNSIYQFGTDIYTNSYSWNQISVSISGGIGITSDGKLWTWGLNSSGQLGDNSTIASLSPRQIGTSNWSSVYAGYLFNIAERSDGALFTWGNNANGQLGLGNTINRSSPVQVGTSSWSVVAAGRYHAAALKNDGSLFIWGVNDNGQLGLGNIINRSSPVQVGTDSWTSLTAGTAPNGGTAAGIFAIRSDGIGFAWGSNNVGQLGLGNNINRSSPVQVGTSSWTSMGSGGDFTSSIVTSFGITSGGTAYQWGRVYGLELPFNNLVYSSPVQMGNQRLTEAWYPIKLSNSSWKQVAAGGNFSVGIKSDGTIYTWGQNNKGQLGLGDTVFRSSAVQVGTNTWKSVSASVSSTFAISSDSSFWSWGDNYYGKLGLNDIIDRSSPVQIGSSNWTMMNIGNRHASAIRNDGALFTWGTNFNGQLGIGDIIYRSSPVLVGTSSWSSVSAGTSHTVAVRTDGALYAWGNDWYGSYVDPYRGVLGGVTLPQQTVSSWKLVNTTGAGIKSDGSLWVWGFGANWSSGYVETAPALIPIKLGASSWAMVNADGGSYQALRVDGSMFAWGTNGTGQLGLNDRAHRSSPTQVGTSSWSTLGSNTTSGRYAAIRIDGALFTWGDNTNGSLGLNENYTIAFTDRSSPSQVGTSSWTAVSLGNDTSAAIRRDGGLFTWGNGVNGQLGIGTFAGDLSWRPSLLARSSPTQVGTSSWTSVSASLDATMAIRRDGALFVMGVNQGNEDGPIGTTGTTGISYGPNGTVYSWSNISSGSYAVFAIRSDGTLWTWGNNGSSGAEGVLGLNSTIGYTFSPVQVGTSSWTSVSAGTLHGIAIRRGGSLFTWGQNNTGQLGLNDSIARSSPTQVGTSSWAAISAGHYHNLATKGPGLNLFAWGTNTSGQLGDLDITPAGKSSPIQIGTSSWSVISAGNSISAGILRTGQLYVWGNNDFSRLAIADGTYRSSPVQVGTSSWTAVSINNNHTTVAIRQGGSLFTWGLNIDGALGHGDYGTVYSSPVQVGTSSWVSVNALGPATLAIRAGGSLFGWGLGSVIGSGDTISRSSPVQIGTSSWSSLGTTNTYTAAAIKAGQLFLWGDDTYLGLEAPYPSSEYWYPPIARISPVQMGTTLNRWITSPTQLGTDSWTTVSALAYSGYAGSKTAGSLWVWGDNGAGQLGLNDAINRSSPVQLAGTWSSFYRNDAKTAGIKSDQTAFVWGPYGNYSSGLGLFNGYGTLSSPTLLGSYPMPYAMSPIQVGTNSWVSVTTGNNNTFGFRR